MKIVISTDAGKIIDTYEDIDRPSDVFDRAGGLSQAVIEWMHKTLKVGAAQESNEQWLTDAARFVKESPTGSALRTERPADADVV